VTDAKYIGLDVHQATISVAVLDSTGKLMMESILETKAATILQFFQGLRGSVYVALEEGTCAAWLHDLLQPHVTKVLVCDPRKNSLLKAGNKSDRIDARKLADLQCRTDFSRPIRSSQRESVSTSYNPFLNRVVFATCIVKTRPRATYQPSPEKRCSRPVGFQAGQMYENKTFRELGYNGLTFLGLNWTDK